MICDTKYHRLLDHRQGKTGEGKTSLLTTWRSDTRQLIYRGIEILVLKESKSQ